MFPLKCPYAIEKLPLLPWPLSQRFLRFVEVGSGVSCAFQWRWLCLKYSLTLFTHHSVIIGHSMHGILWCHVYAKERLRFRYMAFADNIFSWQILSIAGTNGNLCVTRSTEYELLCQPVGQRGVVWRNGDTWNMCAFCCHISGKDGWIICMQEKKILNKYGDVYSKDIT